ncbi:MAG: GTPase ObgE [Candidatus Pacebacteria bacterium]|nr:GTPase ObgE [Candidatus Paceibacterota bacterium]MBP9818532.1 GTPase ObgE [Candidatus Paceibacterota bacterium]
MAFIDEMTVHVRAGRGGNGVVRWLHEKFKEFGGPSGGDGGRGAHVYVKAVRDTTQLARYKNIKEFNAPNGEAGGNNSKHGGNGEDMYIDLPVGSVITNRSTKEVYRLNQEGEKIQILKGGNGGLGNERFKSSTNQTPEEWTPGKNGEEADFYIEVELIADAGLIGLPNAGKSSLLNALTKAHAKIGAYQFTTLEPNLGALYDYVLADIPGLIEGASEGRGLGHKFLRHIKRTKMLFHCISLEHETVDEIQAVYKTIRKELEDYHPDMILKKEVILLTKSDVYTPTLLAEKVAKIKSSMKEWKGKDVLVVSVYDIDSLKQLSDFLTKEFAEANKKEMEEKEINDAQAEKDAKIGNFEGFENNGTQKAAKAMKKIARKPRVIKPKKDSKTNAGGAKSRTNKK